MAKRKTTPLEIFDYVYYDPTSPTGLRWKKSAAAKIKIGDHAGWMSNHYYRFTFKGESYSCHVIIWEIHNGPVPAGFDVDHEDTIKTNNLIGNLRLATHSQNQHNSNTKTNPLNVKGLYKYPNNPKYIGAISFKGVAHRFSHEDRSVVEQWLIDKRIELHGAFARH